MAKKKTTEPTAFGIRLREVRTAAGMTQSALSKTVGMGAVLIARLETSPAANPTLETIKKLASALGCTVEDLVKESGR